MFEHFIKFALEHNQKFPIIWNSYGQKILPWKKNSSHRTCEVLEDRETNYRGITIYFVFTSKEEKRPFILKQSHLIKNELYEKKIYVFLYRNQVTSPAVKGLETPGNISLINLV